MDSAWHHQQAPPTWNDTGTADEQWAQLGQTLEYSLDGFLPTQAGGCLQKSQRGRLQSSRPARHAEGRQILKPSRPSEVALRSDMVGSATKAWFRQLRRLQSYVAAVRALKQTPSAVAYRLELWGSIRKSAGFTDGFSWWWRYHRQHTVPGAPVILPCDPPPLQIALPIFEAFKLCFEHFEAWHLRQRCKLLKAKYDKGMKGIFHNLRRPVRDQLDFLHEAEDFAVLAVDINHNMVHVDHPAPPDASAKWTWDGQPLAVRHVDGSLLTLHDPPPFEFGHVLTQHRVLSSHSQIHAALLDYWKLTWCKWADVDADTWTRVINFFSAYVPKIGFPLEPIELHHWKRALRRFRPTAARGVDGVSHVDLQMMPDAWTLRLLALLNKIETANAEWPTAILYGMVNLLAKDPGATTIARFRPVVIFSVIYRTWASIRAQQLLRRLSAHMNCEAYGFRPGHENQHSSVWFFRQRLSLRYRQVLICVVFRPIWFVLSIYQDSTRSN